MPLTTSLVNATTLLPQIEGFENNLDIRSKPQRNMVCCGVLVTHVESTGVCWPMLPVSLL